MEIQPTKAYFIACLTFQWDRLKDLVKDGHFGISLFPVWAELGRLIMLAEEYLPDQDIDDIYVALDWSIEAIDRYKFRCKQNVARKLKV